MHEWDKELLKRARFTRAFERLRTRGRENPRLLSSAAVHRSLTLQWVLRHEEAVTREILHSLKRGEVALDALQRSVATFDKPRTIYVAAWPERILLGVMAEILTEKTSPFLSSRLYSYQKGKGPDDACRDLRYFLKKQFPAPVYILKRDIAAYGDSLSQEKLFASLGQTFHLETASLFWPLLRNAVRCTFQDESGVEGSLCRGIPSGMPLVPPLENLYLRELDERLAKLTPGFYGRYGDDFLFASPDLPTLLEAEAILKSVLEERELVCNEKKQADIVICQNTNDATDSRFAQAQGIDWLGHRVTVDGLLGIQSSRFQEVLSLLRREVLQITQNLGKLGVSIDEKSRILKSALRDLLDPRRSSELSQLLYRNQNDQVFREFDREVARFTVNTIGRQWRLSKGEAWRVFRRVKPPSAQFVKWSRKGLGNGDESSLKAA